MRRSLYILGALAILTGCSSDPNPVLTEEEQMNAIADELGLKRPGETVEPNTHLSGDFGHSFAQPTAPSPSISSVASKPEADVTALLGKPTATENGEWTSLSTEEKTPFVRHTYKADTGEVSVMFIEGVAARIEVRPSEAFKYPDDAIKAMRAAGLAVEDGATPERENPLYLDYGQVDGFYNVRVVKDVEGNPENVGYVKVVTESRFK
ncbi:membrane lipoprotein lipid attachment site-containing protein [Brevibacillus fortis]|uniref:membrane lipoprotein lipid attachment site-containing protein n=1 Tax=Brevibacillus fortis TaxID=2126352 RepID=UPI0038FC9F7E